MGHGTPESMKSGGQGDLGVWAATSAETRWEKQRANDARHVVVAKLDRAPLGGSYSHVGTDSEHFLEASSLFDRPICFEAEAISDAS